MLGLFIATIVIVWVAYMLSQKYKPQGVLLTAGLILMFCTVAFGIGPVLPAKQSTGFIWFDIFLINTSEKQ